MPAGRPALPLEVKLRRGTVRQDRMPPALVVVPPADQGAIERMGEVGRALLDAGGATWLARTDQIVLLRLLDEGMTEYATLRQRWVASDFGNETVMKRLGTLEEHLTKWLSLAGLSPTDRGKLGVTAVKAKSKLEELEDRRARRVGPRTS